MEDFNVSEFFETKELPQEIKDLSAKVELLESQLKDIKKVEKECEDIKTKLYEKMLEYGVKTWDLPSGTKITLIYPTEEKREVVKVFDEETFKEKEPSIYEEYIVEKEKVTKARKGYIKVKVNE